MDKILKLYYPNINFNYNLDPLTKKFLDANINNVFGFVKLVRFSWSTAFNKLKKSCVAVKWHDLDDDFEEVHDETEETEENVDDKQKSAKKPRQPTKAKPARLASATANEKNNSSLLSFFQKSQKRPSTSSGETLTAINSKYMNDRSLKFSTNF